MMEMSAIFLRNWLQSWSFRVSKNHWYLVIVILDEYEFEIQKLSTCEDGSKSEPPVMEVNGA